MCKTRCSGEIKSILLLTTFIYIFQITLEGSVFEKLFEADPNITYTFTWNKRNVYKQKVNIP